MKNRILIIILVVSLMLGLMLIEPIRSVEASAQIDSETGLTIAINEVMAENRSGLTDEDGDCEDWIELYNYGTKEIALKGYGLSDKPDQPLLWTLPEIVIKPGAYLLVWASGKNRTENALHTSFKLNHTGETLVLSNPQGVVMDSVLLQNIPPDTACGKSLEGINALVGFKTATPGAANSGELVELTPYLVSLNAPEFSYAAGFYTEGFSLNLNTVYKNAVIYYTLDGSEPNKESLVYKEPIKIDSRIGEPNQYANISGISIYDDPARKEVFKGTVVRAKVVRNDGAESPVATQTYFVDKDMASRYKLPVISLVTDPANLFDYEKGIYVKGKVFDEWYKQNPGAFVQGDSPANYNQRGREWEKPATIQFFEADGTLGFTQNVGIKTSGGWTRANRHKSLRIIAREQYDEKDSIDYDLFPGLMKHGFPSDPLKTFSSVLFRSSGNDWEFSMLRDPFMQSLIADMGIDLQAYRPAIVFVDGEFWGIHNIRETFDENYLENHYGVAASDLVILEGQSYDTGMGVYYGNPRDEKPFHDIIDYVRTHDMTLKEHYDYIANQIDVDNFIKYSAAQIYFDNTDWPGNNIKIWRKKTGTNDVNSPLGHDGKWRWMLYDTDFGYGLYSGGRSYTHNMLEFATTPDGEPWPNPDWSTVLLRQLLTNEEFKVKFVNQFADMLNSCFEPEFVVNRLKEMSAVIEPVMQEHIDRWKILGGKISEWRSQISTMSYYAQSRPKTVFFNIQKYCDFEKRIKVTLEASDVSGGTIQINSIKPDLQDGPWSGTYFTEVPLAISAIPKEGYIFSGWEGTTEDKASQQLKVIPAGDISLKAVFTKK